MTIIILKKAVHKSIKQYNIYDNKNEKTDRIKRMRIITGEFKGRRLYMPENNNVRPTSEKVKEAIFSTLHDKVYEAHCLDLFSGTGNLGLEAISRGADFCYFCDSNRDSIALTTKNIEMCRAKEYAQVRAGDFERNLIKLGEMGEKFDIIFLDPPYKMALYDTCFKLIREYELLNKDGVVVTEHDSRDVFPETYEGYEKIKDKVYGHIGITIYS